MADRTVYGRTHSENGWRMVDQGSCRRVRIPGTNVTIQIREGQPVAILGAFAADYHAHVEPLRQADSGGWTPTNSVASSNHLSGTAMDLNWNGPDGRTFRLGIPEERAYPPPKNQVVRELLAFYEGLVFCGGAWSIRDWMHFQMGANTYGARNVERVNDFIRRKIRADGFSTFRRVGTPPPPPAPPPSPQLTQSERYALRIIREGQRRGISPRGIKIALSVALVESELQMLANRNVPESLARNPDGSQKYPHDRVGSDHDSLGLFQQRSPMWGQPSCLMNVECSAGLFYDRLAELNYNDPNRTPGSFAADIQRPAAQYRDRYQQRYSDAERLYNRLLVLPEEEDELTPEQDRMLRDLHALYVTDQLESVSPLRKPGEGKRANIHLFIRWMDANIHVLTEAMLATLRFADPDAIARLQEVANLDLNQFPARDRDRKLARALLLQADADDAPPTQSAPPQQTAPTVYTPAPAVYSAEVEPEVLLPAVPEPEPIDQAGDLLNVLDRLIVFNKDYREKFDELTGGEETK